MHKGMDPSSSRQPPTTSASQSPPPSNPIAADAPSSDPRPFAPVPAPPPLQPITNIDIKPKVDERCWTYCTQRSNSRIFQAEPICHTFCWRKIWDYERSLIYVASHPDTLPVKIGVPYPSKSLPEGKNPADTERRAQERYRAQRQRLQKEASGRPRPALSEQEVALVKEWGANHKEMVMQMRALIYGCKMGQRMDCFLARNRLRANDPELFEGMAEEWLVEMGKREADPEHALEIADRFLAQAMPVTQQAMRELRDGMLEEKQKYYPFPAIHHSMWSLLRGHYIFYARGPRPAIGHMQTMSQLGMQEGWANVAKAMEAEGQVVDAVLDGRALIRQKRQPPRSTTVGLKDLRREEEMERMRQDQRSQQDPANYAMLISLEHVPDMIYNRFSSTIHSVFSPVLTLMGRMRDSYASGQGTRNLTALWERALDMQDGPVGTMKRLGEAFEKRRKEIEREREDEKEKENKGRGGKA